MPAAPPPPDESERLEELRSLDLLDTLPEQDYDDLAALAAHVAGTPIALVSLVDEDRQWFKAAHGLDARQTPRDQAFCAHAILDPAEMLVVPDATADPRFADNPLVTGDPDIRFYAGTPLTTPSGHALGTLCVLDREARTLSEVQLGGLAAIGRQVVNLLELRRHVNELAAAALVRAANERRLTALQEELEATVQTLTELTRRDPLTGLFNRSALEDRLTVDLAAHRRSGRPVAVTMVDLDHFKNLNDTHGHAAGDEALRAVASVLQETVRESDTAARYGGEEFTVVLSDTDRPGAERAAERLRAAIASLDLPTGRVTASLGVACADGRIVRPDQLIEFADEALYDAKESGRDRVVVRPAGDPSTEAT